MKHNHKDLAAQLQQIADRLPHLNPHNSQPDGTAGTVRAVAEPPLLHTVSLNETNTSIPETSAASPFVNIRVHSWKKKKQETCEVCSSEAAPLSLSPSLTLSLEPTKLPSLDSFLLNHFHLEGARALRFLIQHPDEEFTALTLIQILSGTIAYERYIPHDLMLRPPEDRDTLQESSIPMTDEKTLDAIKKRMDEIHTQKAKLQNRQPDCAELDAELDQLRKYLLECSRANGQLRSFNGVSRRPYQALCANINRVRKLLRKHDPQLDAYVAQHLKASPYFCWTCTVAR